MVQTRDVAGQEAESIDDWQTVDVAFTTVRHQPKVKVPVAGESISLPGGLMLHGHSSLEASVRLTTESLFTHDLGGTRLPRLLTEDPSICVPLTYAGPNGFDPGLSVVELCDVLDPSAVTPDNPLRLTVPVALSSSEHVVAVAYDGEFFLPVGRAEVRTRSETSILIDHLPPPLADGHSLAGSIKICLEKVTNRWADPGARFPRLAVVEFPADADAIVRTLSVAEIRDRAAASKRVLLLIHGVVGGSLWMAQGLQNARLHDGRRLSDIYELVLAFEYETLNRPIEENALHLRAQLEEAGLETGPDKQFDVVAHSTGGLVARWFIEREGGKSVVRKLVMVGTPNAGVLWSDPAHWARVSLGLGFNGLTALPWPASVTGLLAALAEAPLSTLSETAPGSTLLQDLAESPDPGIPYVLVAGHASVITGPAEPKSAGANRLTRLLGRLAQMTLPAAGYLGIIDEPNDLAVTEKSMHSLSPGRIAPVEVVSVACDHLNYFEEPTVQEHLFNALRN
jgi:pimeloyl-ACP methyl ester carboxylesterase